MQVRNLRYVLAGEDKSASKTFDKVGKKADGLHGKLSGLGRSAALGVAGAGAALGAGLASALVAGIKGASDLAESTSKVNTVFGESSSVIRDFSQTAARDLGMTRQAALEATGTFGNLFSALGIGVKPAADMSTKLTTLATDLGSFNNVSSDEALLALRSGLLGEAEPLRKFGVSLSAARIEAEALSSGLVKPVKNMEKITAAQNGVEAAAKRVAEAQKKYGKESLQARQATDGAVRAEGALRKAMKGEKVTLDAATKAQAAYAIILKDTKVAQGDFARTSGGLANQTKILKAQLSDTATSIGEKLLPNVTKLANWLNDEAVPAVQRFIDQFDKGVGRGGEFRDFLADAGNKARDMAPYVQTAYEKLKQIIGFIAEHPDAFTAIALGVGAYATAMKAAHTWTKAMAALDLLKIATGMGAINAAGGAGAAGAGAPGGKKGGKLPLLLAPPPILAGAAAGAGTVALVGRANKNPRTQQNTIAGTTTATIGVTPRRAPNGAWTGPLPARSGDDRRPRTTNLVVSGRVLATVIEDEQGTRTRNGAVPVYGR